MILRRMSMPTRVLAVGNAYPPHHLGGYEIAWRGVMRRLQAEGHAVRILTTDYRRDDVTGTDAEDPDVRRELDWYWREHQWRSVRPLARLALERHNAAVLDHQLRSFRPDVITWWPVGGLSLGMIERARRAGLPAVLFVHDYWLSYGPEHDLWMRTWTRIRQLSAAAEKLTGLPTSVDYAGAGRWLFNSRAVRDDALAHGVRPVDSAIVSPGVADAFLRVDRELEPPEWRWRLLYVGRVVEQKGVSTAIKALPLLPKQATLTIVGDGDREYRALLERLVAELRVSDQVVFVRARAHEDLIAVYRAADAVVFPVEWDEPWGLVPLEAMALGRPVVATGRGGSGEYLEPTGNSLVFDAGDAASLSAALHALASDRTLRDRLRRGGYETAARHSEDAFNRRAIAEILEAARPSGEPR
jgi:glycogen synthase